MKLHTEFVKSLYEFVKSLYVFARGFGGVVV